MTTIHVMVDLETLGTGPRAAIIQIGACAFELEGNAISAAPPTFEATVSAQSSLFAGLELDPSTLHWWRYTASAAARLAVETNAVPLSVALRDFAAWFTSVKVTSDSIFLWANGAAFDPPILESAHRALGLTVPWNYGAVRDTRTIYHLARDLAGWERPKRETAHTALVDAIAQAEDVRAAYAALRERTRR